MLNDILGRARRRILSHRLYATFLVSGAVLAGGLVLLLILGTTLWNWWIPLLLLAISLAIGLTLLVLSRPTEGDVAQLLDSRCRLADTLATAVHFRESPLPMATAQRQQAESAATGIELSQVLPFQAPRATYVFAGLVVAVAGLFLFRFGSEKQLDLRAPIAAIPFLSPDENARAEDKARRDREAKAKADLTLPANALDRLGTSTSDNPEERDVASPPGSAVTNAADGKNQDVGATADGKKPDGTGNAASDSAQAGMSPPKEGAEQPPSSREGAPQSAQGGAKNSGEPNSSGLMSKLRDAVSGLLSKLKPPQGNPQSPNGTPGTQQADGKQSSGQQGGQKPGQQDAKGNPSEQEGQESAAESEQMAPGKGAGKSSEQNASAKPGSGMGHQDGSKELKDAEQLNAMGKLSEIIGKRSANITGEMTIEQQSGPQQLRTGYTHSNARHGEAGGDVNRDEVPVEMQSYVEQYFDQVRKQAAAKAARGSKSTEN